MARYIPPEIKAKRKEILNRFYGLSDSPYAVYAVVERFGRKRTPFYVGETSRPKKRFEQHLKAAYGGTADTRKLSRRERSIIKGGGIIEFHCLELCENRIASLALEASWARSLEIEDCSLVNSWAEHRQHSKIERVPVERLMSISLHDAQIAELSIKLTCSVCKKELMISTKSMVELEIRNPRLRDFKDILSCEGCSLPYNFNVFLPMEIELC